MPRTMSHGITTGCFDGSERLIKSNITDKDIDKDNDEKADIILG